MKKKELPRLFGPFPASLFPGLDHAAPASCGCRQNKIRRVCLCCSQSLAISHSETNRISDDKLLDPNHTRRDFGKILHYRRIVAGNNEFRARRQLLHPVLRADI